MAGEIQKSIFVPRNFLEVLQEMQFDIALESDEIKAVELAHEAVRAAVGSKQNLNIAGSRDVIIHSLTSLVMKRMDKGHRVTTVDETIVRGNIDALQVVRFDNLCIVVIFHPVLKPKLTCRVEIGDDVFAQCLR